MRKIAMTLALIIVMMLPMTSQAATMRSIGIVPELSYDGTTANCSVIVTGNSSEDEIEITVKLWQGIICLETWHDSGAGYLVFEENATVTKGQKYSMTVDVTIDGVVQTRETVSSICQ